MPTVLHLQRLASYGVSFHSYTEPMLSTDNEMVRDIVLAVMASLAKIERQKISDRTRAGMERVRRQGSKSGKAIGRPRISAQTRGRIVEMLVAGAGIRTTARAVGAGNETVHRIAREIRGARAAEARARSTARDTRGPGQVRFQSARQGSEAAVTGARDVDKAARSGTRSGLAPSAGPGGWYARRGRCVLSLASGDGHLTQRLPA